MDRHILLKKFIADHPGEIGKVVDYETHNDHLFHFDFTAKNTELTAQEIADTAKFCLWINKKLNKSKCRYGIGGYMEHRTLYNRSTLFDNKEEPRRLHLGVDIWGNAGTAVYSPIIGYIHSFRDNDNFGDYGPTIILKHNLDGLTLYSLYGHLSRHDLAGLSAGDPIPMGQQIGRFGNSVENGNWPPHLHFQLMFDIEGNYGDYPGVGRFSEKAKYLLNIPDPNLILQF